VLDAHNLVDKILPGAIYQAIADADSLFKIDMPAMHYGRLHKKRQELITIAIILNHFFQSMDWIVGPCSLRWHELVLKWFPQVEASVLPRATH
jgi:hypothetical protein